MRYLKVNIIKKESESEGEYDQRGSIEVIFMGLFEGK